MSNALMIRANPSAEQDGNFTMLVGGTGLIATEANTAYQATEAATFRNLYANIIVGGGTNTCQFRKNGTNVNLLIERLGIGTVEDTSGSDVLVAADTFDLALTDTGADPNYAAIRANVEFSSGYGCFFGTSDVNGAIYDAASSTRFISLAGALGADGNTTEVVAAFLCHGASVFEAFQVNVISNARTNDVVIRNRINGANGTGVITIGAAATGLFTATGLADAIADGDEVCLSITLLTGVEDLELSFVGATLKDSGGEMEIWTGLGAGENRPASATPSYYCIGGQLAASATESNRWVPPGFALTARNLRVYISANSYSTDATCILRVNAATAITTTITAAVTGWFDPAVGTAVIGASDLLSFEVVGGTTGSITIHMIGFTYAPDVAVGGTVGSGLTSGVLLERRSLV